MLTANESVGRNLWQTEGKKVKKNYIIKILIFE